jgi:DNA (cytosine-5)-methyltransferase 1
MKKKPSLPLKVIELFAGVGGFREAMSTRKTKGFYKVIWSNQWEPKESKKKGDHQTANMVYLAKFAKEGSPHCSEDIDKVTGEKGMPKIPESFDLLVGGFPCQDYSVAKPRNASEGINGPKGVLWWNIRKILEKRTPRFVLLENVDLLVKSPSECRGRDFAIILKCLDELGYIVEWRVINAGDYGYAQRRRRTYIFAYKPNIQTREHLRSLSIATLREHGLLNKIFKIKDLTDVTSYEFDSNVDSEELKATYEPKNGTSPFKATGIMANGKCISANHAIVPGIRRKQKLRDVLLKKHEVKDESELDSLRIRGQDRVNAWAYVKGRKDEIRRKLQPLEKYVQSRTAGVLPMKPVEIKNLAKTLPRELELDVLVRTKGKGPKLLTREDINEAVRGALGYDKLINPNRKELTHEVISKALASQVVMKRVEQSIVQTLKNRSIPSRALNQMTCNSVTSIRQAIKLLTAKNKLYGYPTKVPKTTFDRDSVANASIAYRYQEGAMAFPDPLNKPSRTIITSEAGPSVSRFKHVICELCARREGGHKTDKNCQDAGQLRRLHPIEIERLNGFPQSHSDACEKAHISPNKRIMLMGNAVVVDLLEDVFMGLATRQFAT